MPPIPKSPETIVSELEDGYRSVLEYHIYGGDEIADELSGFVRSALASIVAYAAEKVSPVIECDGEFHNGYIVTKEQFEFALLKLAEEIEKGE